MAVLAPAGSAAAVALEARKQADVHFMGGIIPRHAQAVKIALWAATHDVGMDHEMLMPGMLTDAARRNADLARSVCMWSAARQTRQPTILFAKTHASTSAHHPHPESRA